MKKIFCVFYKIVNFLSVCQKADEFFKCQELSQICFLRLALWLSYCLARFACYAVFGFCKNGVANLAFALKFWKFFVVKFAVFIENVLAQSLHFLVKFDFKFHPFKRILQDF